MHRVYPHADPSVPDGTVVRLRSAFFNYGWHIEGLDGSHVGVGGWWSESMLDLCPNGKPEKKKSGFGKFIGRIENGEN